MKIDYKTLFDFSMNNPEEILEFEMEYGDIFLVKFSHLDIDVENYIDEYNDSKGLIYKIISVKRRIKYDYLNAFIEITRDYLPKRVEANLENIIQ